jgi:biofilm PGA synthesis N-glycosyltransferase PgaC
MLSLYIFWIGLCIVIYTYLGYALVLLFLTAFKPKPVSPKVPDDPELPHVALVIAAYNEGKIIREKIRNTLGLHYPADKLHVIFVTDGSSDETPEIIRNYPQFTLLHQPVRNGKIHAVNRAMKEIESPVTVFCDANSFLNPQALRYLVRHYQDANTGGVAGEKRIFQSETNNASASGEGIYWKYESFLKAKDAELHTVVGAAGELFSIRTELFEPPPDDMIIEDFFLSMKIAGKGYRFAYEPEAYAMEAASVSVSEEWKRKVRISAGAFQAMSRLADLLNPFGHGILTFQYFSHRVLRWTLAPVFLPLIFVCNVILLGTNQAFYQLAFAFQLIFYLAALAGFALRDRRISIRGFFVPYYFVVMNAAVYAGFFRHILGKQKVTWDQAERAELNIK